ncbi:EamA family transporter [Candidatus Woesearchaeota archaeon]|nr:EamA family transporter [Candidatus Woesearchaeota archaeon]
MKSINLILLSVVGVSAGQLLLKYGMNSLAIDFGLANLLNAFVQVFSNVFVLLGLLTFFVSSILWLVVLSKTDLSLAYPLLAIGYIVVVVASWLFLGESIGLTRVLGIVIICGGVFLLSRT